MIRVAYLFRLTELRLIFHILPMNTNCKATHFRGLAHVVGAGSLGISNKFGLEKLNAALWQQGLLWQNSSVRTLPTLSYAISGIRRFRAG